MLEGEVENLWFAAKANPRAALREAHSVLEHDGEPEELAWAHAAAGRAYFELGQNEAAILAFEESLGSAPTRLHERVTISLAAALASSGRTSQALARLDEVATSADPTIAALAKSQLGLLELHAGRPTDALAILEPALIALADNPAEVEAYARALGNAGYAELMTGRLDSAITRFDQASELARLSGQTTVVAGCAQNTGYALMRQGDLPRALSALEAARQVYRENDDPGRNLSTLLDDLAETYRIAGLTGDAVHAAQQARRMVATGGNLEKQADAAYRLARCQLDAHDPSAIATATDAAKQFASAGRTNWVRRSELLRIEALAELGTETPDQLLAALEQVVDPGEAVDGDLDSRSLRNLIALKQLQAGEPDKARHALGNVLVDDVDQSVMAQIETHLSAALVAVLDNECLESHADAASDLIRAHMVRLGDPELRAGASRLVDRIRQLFVGTAIDRGEAMATFAFEERFRSISLGFARAVPSPDAQTASISQELRDLSRSLELPGEHDPEDRVRVRELEAELRRRSLQHQVGQGIAAPRMTDMSQVADVARDRQVIEWVELNGRLYVLTCDGDVAHLEESGELGDICARARQIRTDLARLARPGLTPQASSRRWATLLDDCQQLSAILLPASEYLTRSHHGWLLSPPKALTDLPWSLLLGASNDGRPVSVVPSASWWLQTSTDDALPLRFASIVGPDLEYARAEADGLASVFESKPPATTVESALNAIEDASLLHVASHGSFRSDSPRFSSLRLDDGPLALHEVDRVSTVPDAVVLAACDTGRHTSASGGDLLGFVPTWLAAGSASVVAPICAVGDEATSAFVDGLYAALARPGTGVSSAVAMAQADLDTAPSEVRAAAHSFINVGCDIRFVSKQPSSTR